MRLGFAGTPDFAAIILRELTKTPHDFVQILTHPARPRGEGVKSFRALSSKRLIAKESLVQRQPI
ncbi:MAG: hypothetical protein Ct9H300mP8_08360 [Gammaproteobacteria bacterium]|nr:MAG: hypothetical protein Ct9H300mP8_08360 [Gammaproteobacteria bacterium]